MGRQAQEQGSEEVETILGGCHQSTMWQMVKGASRLANQTSANELQSPAVVRLPGETVPYRQLTGDLNTPKRGRWTEQLD